MKFSVIIPVYNKADTIQAAVNSVYAQTISDYEIIVVDDGSRDALAEALVNLHGPKLNLIQQQNGGVSVARNTGIAHAKGDYICFLDADDLWKPHHLETLAKMIEKYPDSTTFITSHEIITPDGKLCHSNVFLNEICEDIETDDLIGFLNRTSYSVVHTNSICVKCSMLNETGVRFEPGVRIGEDTDVWYRLGLKHSVVISRNESTIYRQEYSTATKNGSYVHNWIFSRRIEEFLSDDSISARVKQSLICLQDRYKMTGSREYMLEGNRKEAKRILSEIKMKRGKRYVLTVIFTSLPYCLCKKLLRK